jgi:uncharacterized membrane protein YcaP (DUF421 family)
VVVREGDRQYADLAAAARLQNIATIGDVAWAVMERSRAISLIKDQSCRT